MTRVLVATNFLEEWTGSEVVALEVAEHFGATVTGYWAHVPAVSLVREWLPIDRVDLSQYDVVWAQHHAIVSLLDRIKGDTRPYVIWASMSPYDDTETLPPGILSHYVDRVVANSAETAQARGIADVFENAAPAPFHFEREQRPLRRILFVSNNQPPEMLEAARILKNRGFELRFIGRGREFKRVEPADIAWADCVVTIGKTVRYALASGTPVFVYDRFGGDGYLTDANYAENEGHNFSGRPGCRRLGAEALADAIVLSHSYWTPPPQPVLGELLDAWVAGARRQPFERVPDLRATAAMAQTIGNWMSLNRAGILHRSSPRAYLQVAATLVKKAFAMQRDSFLKR